MKTNYFRILQSQVLLSRTVIIKLSTDFLNILLMGTDYLPVPRSSMRNTIAMLAQIHKYVKLCREVVAAEPFPGFVSTNAQTEATNWQFLVGGGSSNVKLFWPPMRLPATRRQQSGVSNPQPGGGNQPINQRSPQSLVAASRHSIQRETGDTKMPIWGRLAQTVLRSTGESNCFTVSTQQPIIWFFCLVWSWHDIMTYAKQVFVFRFVWLNVR